MQQRQADITSPEMKDNQTWNDCPNCCKYWHDVIATPGLIHRTRLCDDCTRKPIALITDSIPYAVQWALTNFKGNVDSYSNGKREITLKSGQKYIICSQPEHLLAWEISGFRYVGGNQKPVSFFDNMVRLAQSRIR